MFGFLGKLLGGGGAGDGAPESAAGPAVDYKGFTIVPEPYRNGGQWQLAARITKTVDGEPKEHHLIRADLLADPDEARSHALAKAQRVIDEQGDGLFG
ncbi:MAG: HlyU family transcriptional regulator [Pseudomonadota bacterium]